VELGHDGVFTFDSVRDDAQGHSFDFGFRVGLGRAVGHHAEKRGNLGDPATIVFLLELDSKVRTRNIPKPIWMWIEKSF